MTSSVICSVILCIISTISFCFCLQVVGRVLMAPTLRYPWLSGSVYSARARRLARGYFLFAFSVLTIASLIFCAKSFFELFA